MKKNISTYAVLAAIAVIAIVFLFFPSVITVIKEGLQKTPLDTLMPPPVVIREYGLAVDSFEIEKGKIKPNQNLSVLLAQFHLPNVTINKITSMSDTVFNVKNIKSGNHYSAFFSKDSLRILKYLVYEHTPSEYIMFDLNDTINVSKNEKEVTVIKKYVYCPINSSLWNAMAENHLNPLLAVELEKIYGWTIDFFDLKKEDYFKVIYEELYADSQSYGLGEIYAVYFRHNGKDIFAIPFMQDSSRSYFDKDGSSLKKSFLKAPLSFSRISSRFTNHRFHPVLKIFRPHFGVDYCAPTGTPVHTIGSGTVISAGYSGGAGNMLKVKHNNDYTTSYMHLSRIAKGIRSGVRVEQGEVIGYVGSTGLSTGPHLDFRIYKNGKPVDPLKLIAPPADPVKKENMQAFTVEKDSLLNLLNNIAIDSSEVE